MRALTNLTETLCLRALAQKNGGTIDLERLVGSVVMIIEEVQGKRVLPVDVGDNVRSRYSAHTTSTGRLLTAGLSEAKLKTTLLNKLAALTPFNITDNQILRNQLEEIRLRGWALA